MAQAPSSRTRIRRVPKRGLYDRATIAAILDESLVAHVGFSVDEQPYVIPMLIARLGDRVYMHGSTASRMVRKLSAGVPACLTTTLVDGLVLARSAFHHSMNYRSVVVLGTATLVEGADERADALEAFTEKLLPGRWDEVRQPNAQELKGTRVLTMELTEASAKVREGGPVDDEGDYAFDVWAGVVPLALTAGAPIPDARLRAGVEPSAAVTGWAAARGDQTICSVRSADSSAS
ncbi:pyridoxamine 5'-phosphate oxidase family protein [Conexibacter sp. JD483]|uniref:pyridoxamine 5'-phosphate oxidase family protein n=1 Tax=unclassified Conexibacter TaxID=2627773 RepID=UPI002723E722|nr:MULTISPECIES: pyridoxamine 5'-phosphate oxidase family protein [unclassified Conexibacter]MDO8186642.1 pyridoxamine 5'-phosphate oxidase family protein [Conexibacter sp. CPCC 205706]MDO8200362.1 pyridoxamine 5'-phosphate oxidase family protein [Conexibacter sp. CPCC 205762]MDR9370616.1 pyridoxamine 5'-phosphate oxidase family protein [Conexibacter sp. JD483]